MEEMVAAVGDVGDGRTATAFASAGWPRPSGWPEVAAAGAGGGCGGQPWMREGNSGGMEWRKEREKVERRDEISECEGESQVWPKVFSSFSREKR
jgi:hypothetical protein